MRGVNVKDEIAGLDIGFSRKEDNIKSRRWAKSGGA